MFHFSCRVEYRMANDHMWEKLTFIPYIHAHVVFLEAQYPSHHAVCCLGCYVSVMGEFLCGHLPLSFFFTYWEPSPGAKHQEKKEKERGRPGKPSCFLYLLLKACLDYVMQQHYTYPTLNHILQTSPKTIHPFYPSIIQGCTLLLMIWQGSNQTP